MEPAVVEMDEAVEAGIVIVCDEVDGRRPRYEVARLR
jgi:hypothetical protein